MFVLIVELEAAPGLNAELADLLCKLVASAQTEDGIHFYAVQQDQARAGYFVLSEFYADEAAWQAHLAHPLVKAYLAEFPRLLQGAPRIIRCNAVAASTWRN